MSSHAHAPKAPLLKDKNLYAELIGTFLLVFLAVLTHYFVAPTSGEGLITYIIGVLLLAHCIVGISGCHLNPAVSIAATLNHEITWADCIRYIIGQILGALLAGLLFFAIFEFGGHTFHISTIQTSNLNTAEGIPTMMFTQFGLVFVFVMLVLGGVGTFERTKLGGVVVAATLVVEHLFGILVHGASVNPAIPLASIFIADDIGMAIANIWLYIVPSILAAFAAGLVGKKLFAHMHHAKPGQFAGHNVLLDLVEEALEAKQAEQHH